MNLSAMVVAAVAAEPVDAAGEDVAELATCGRVERLALGFQVGVVAVAK